MDVSIGQNDNTTSSREDDSYLLDSELLQSVCQAIAAEDRQRLLELVKDLHQADLADLIEQIDTDSRRTFIRLVGLDIAPETFTDLEEDARYEAISELESDQIADIVSDLESDKAVDLLEDLEQEQRTEVLEQLDDIERHMLEQSLAYPEETAGRMMQRELVVAPKKWSVGDAIDKMRSSKDLPQLFYEIIVVDSSYHPVGVVSLSHLMGSKRQVALSKIMRTEFRSLLATEPQEDVAYAFNQYHLVSAPVVDDSGRLVGVITIDDAIQVLEDETEEDLRRLGGVGDEGLSEDVRTITLRRLPWLVVNMITAILASIVIGQFDESIEQIVALAVLMPIVTSMGGNAATQTLTVSVRALATKDLTNTNSPRIVKRELHVGIANGLLFAFGAAALAYIWFFDWGLAAVFAMAMVISMVIAGITGILTPLGLRRLGVDPALASAAFVTSVTDVVGFFAFLGLASLMLI